MSRAIRLPEPPQLIAEIKEQKIQSQAVILILEMRLAKDGSVLELDYEPKAFISVERLIGKDGAVAVASAIEQAIKQAKAWMVAKALVGMEHPY